MNDRAIKLASFLTRLRSRLPCEARLVSRWLFLFRRVGAFVFVCLVSIDPVGARSKNQRPFLVTNEHEKEVAQVETLGSYNKFVKRAADLEIAMLLGKILK